MRDSDLLELAATFLTSGSEEPRSQDDDQRGQDVVVDLFFETGYTLDQVGATLDAVDTILTAGFIAAEVRQSGQSATEILGRLTSPEDPLDITWEVDTVEPGSLHIKAVVKRSGAWVSKHKDSTGWVLGGVGIFLPAFGIPVLVAGAAAWGAAGAIVGTAYLYDRSVQRKKAQGSAATAVPATIHLAPRSENETRPEPTTERRPLNTDVYDVIIDGDDSSKEELVNRLHMISGVEPSTRLLTGGPNAGRAIRIWSAHPIDEATLRRLAIEAGTRFVRVDVLPRVYH
jgi:hypothetical protein